MSDTFCFVVGARPNFMKAAPILRASAATVLAAFAGEPVTAA